MYADEYFNAAMTHIWWRRTQASTKSTYSFCRHSRQHSGVLCVADSTTVLWQNFVYYVYDIYARVQLSGSVSYLYFHIVQQNECIFLMAHQHSAQYKVEYNT